MHFLGCLFEEAISILFETMFSDLKQNNESYGKNKHFLMHFYIYEKENNANL